ncbi:competence type IV pilus assembly protein ComGB [Sporosarcina sp. 179-K 3D1 HS]|uniref:competence type IV pilus assembly protein ComGB n=1 Tax=Sporosarcina sp. 179-K 3D1 HS TaxID=3232169 RepID=UPI00399F47B3
MNKGIEKLTRKNNEILQNRPSFLKRLAVLLDEGYTFHDSLLLLLPHHVENYHPLLQRIEKDLTAGHGVTHILRRIGFAPGSLLPVAIAEIDGQLGRALNEMANRLNNKEEKQKRLRTLLLYPTVLFLFIAALLLAFRGLFLPNLEMLAVARQGDGGFVSLLPVIVSRIPDAIFLFALLLGSLTAGFFFYYRKLPVERKIRLMISIPIVGPFFMQLKTRDFSNEMGSLLQSGLSLQNSLSVLIEQDLDNILSEISRKVRDQVIYGESFHAAIEMTDGLTKQLASFARHGADSGYLAKELLIYSDHLNDLIERQLSQALALLQPILFSGIAVCILAAYLAILLPVYGMLDHL